MAVRIVCLLALGAGMIWTNASEWKKGAVRDKVVYILLLAPICYLGVLYAAHLNGFNLNDLVHAAVGKPAKRIVEAIQLPS